MNIELTQTAADEIRRVADQQDVDLQTSHLHIGVQGHGPKRQFALDLRKPQESDEVNVRSQGITLACSNENVRQLDGATIDFRDQETVGRGFTFDLPPDRQKFDGAGDLHYPPPEEDEIRQVLRQVNDPEVGVNIVDLGLVYGLVTDGRDVRVTMTMTTPACPLSDTIRADVDQRIHEMCPGTGAVEMELVWEPKWSPGMISEAGKQQLGWLR